MIDKPIRYLVLIVTIIAFCVFGTVLVRGLWYNNSETSYGIPLVGLASSSGEVKKSDGKEREERDTSLSNNPVRILIPLLEIDAKIQKVGISKKGNMAVPSNYTDVGWYKYGAAPGEPGSAVMAGHVDNGFRLPGVFKNLAKLEKGDDVYVKLEDGRSMHYVITGSVTYDYDAKVPEVFTESGAHSLKLITCIGNWMPLKKTHDKRLVVTAILAK